MCVLNCKTIIMFLRNRLARHGEASRTNFLTTPMHGQDLTSKSRSIHRQKLRDIRMLSKSKRSRPLTDVDWPLNRLVSPLRMRGDVGDSIAHRGCSTHSCHDSQLEMSVPIRHYTVPIVTIAIDILSRYEYI